MDQCWLEYGRGKKAGVCEGGATGRTQGCPKNEVCGGGGKQAEACHGYLSSVYLFKEGGILYAWAVTCQVKIM